MKKYIKAISLLITVVMLVPLAVACSNEVINITYPESFLPPPEQVESEEAVIPEDRDYLEPFSRYEETVVVTVGRFFNADHDLADSFALGAGSNAVVDMVYNELNIQIEVIFNVPIEEYIETLQRHRAAGTLPDTFQIPNSYEGMRFFNELLQDNKLADLTQALTHTVGGMSKEFLDSWDFDKLFKYVTEDGKIYATPVINQMFNSSFTWIREDWLDELELDMPKTIQELEETALAFMQAGLGGRNTVGITFIPDEMFENKHGVMPIFAAFGAYPTSWIEVNGEIQWGGIQPEVKQALELLRDWTEKGIIRSQMLTMNRTQVVDTYIVTGRSGIFFSDWEQPYFTFNRRGAASQVHNEDLRWVPVLAPVNAHGQYRPANELLWFGGQAVLASHSNPEAVIKAMNLVDEVRNWRNPEFSHLWEEYIRPFEGTVEGIFPLNSLIVPDYRYEIARIITNYRETGGLEIPDFLYYYRPVIESALFDAQGGMEDWWALSNEERSAYLAPPEDEEEVISQQLFFQLRRYTGYWAYGVVGEMFLAGMNDGTYIEMIPAFPALPEATPALNEYADSLMELQRTTFIQIILGRLPLEAFDEFVIEWFEMGGELVTNEVNQLVRVRYTR